MTHASKRSICIISQYFLPDLNGDVIRLLNLLKVLKDEGFEVTIITAFPHYPSGHIPSQYRWKLFSQEKWDGVRVIRTFILPLPHKGIVNRFLLYTSFSLSAVFAAFLTRKIDITWAFSQKLFSYITGLAFKLIRKTRLVLDLTDVWPEAIVNTGYMKDKGLLFSIVKALMKFFYTVSDRVITLTEFMRKMIISAVSDPLKVVVVPNIAQFRRAETSSKVRKFGNNFIVMYSGNLGPNYDFKTLLRAAQALKDEDVFFVVRGKGEMKDFIVNFIRDTGLENICLDERPLSKGELMEYLSSADAFVLPMRKCPYPDASFPIKLLDYLTCGKPVLCCASGYIAELLTRYRAGLVVEPGDWKGLADAILTLKERPEMREEMSRNAKRLVTHLFSRSVLHRTLKAAFNFA